eukprot:COSAG01_NODE_2081_length_8467_cov_15.325645_3_plen_117_part_00
MPLVRGAYPVLDAVAVEQAEAAPPLSPLPLPPPPPPPPPSMPPPPLKQQQLRPVAAAVAAGAERPVSPLSSVLSWSRWSVARSRACSSTPPRQRLSGVWNVIASHHHHYPRKMHRM